MHFSQIIEAAAERNPGAQALVCGDRQMSYQALAEGVNRAAAAFLGLGLSPRQRVGVYLPKCFEAVEAMFAAARAGGVFVPINPALKARQVAHILSDADISILVTSPERLEILRKQPMPSLAHVILVGGDAEGNKQTDQYIWGAFKEAAADVLPAPSGDDDLAALLYTSGSTGLPKGVMVSHRNLVLGAESVTQYLGNTESDRILCVLPFSFDYGLSQLTTALQAGACAVLINYLFPQDIMASLARERITGLACVPPLWIQLVQGGWPEEIAGNLRYITSSGGRMPKETLASLQTVLPDTDIYLMYGLTEAFRSTYLDPREVEHRPESIGKPIPNASIDVLDASGEPCAAGVEGELVHAGPLVAQGYWNNPAATAERFRPTPLSLGGEGQAVWSGDTVRRDAEGFLYFVERRDAMIKSSGYRISPSEVEDVLFSYPGVGEAVVVGAPHGALGEAVVALIVAADGELDSEAVLAHCKGELPGFMVPAVVILRDTLPRNANGKIDRPALADEVRSLFGSS